jgi:vancomycin permeability regulator SanA
MGVWIVYDGIHDDKDHAEVAVVSGYGETKDGNPEPDLQARLDRTAALYADSKFNKVIVSGVSSPGGSDESEAMAHYLEAHQVPSDAIIVDYRGPKAVDSVEGIIRIMKNEHFQTVMVINSYYRLERLKLNLRHEGIKYVEQAHSGEWRKEDLPDVVTEDYKIYNDINTWFLLPTEKIAQEKAKEETKVVEDKLEKLKSEAKTETGK